MNSSPVNDIIKVGKQLEVAYQKRIIDSTNTSVVVFLHGFGSTKDFFRYAFKDPSLRKYSLITLDLIGFGGSSKPESFSYEMSNQASIMLQAINALEIDSFHLCAHSMGGLVGLEMTNQSPPQILSFSNLEGNLSLDDCFFSGKILDYSYDFFVRSGRKEIEEQLMTMPGYLHTFQQASTTALYRSAEHTVKDSKNPTLMQNFISLPTKIAASGFISFIE